MNKCHGCGLCCKLFLINLTKEEYQSGKYKTMFAKFGMFKDFPKARNFGANILAQKEDESCIYYDGSCCSIHKDRPNACRQFFCTSKSKKFENMVKLIESKRSEI